MKKPAAVILFACAALASTAAASATPLVGVAEDATKYAPDGGAALYARMKAYGLTSNRVSVHWDPTNPSTIEEKPFLDKVVPAAQQAGVQLVFAVYPDPAIPGAATAIAQGSAKAFCDYAAGVARAYPAVRKIIIGNEPNQPRFWQPQFAAGLPVAGAQYEPVLATCYDALKAVNPNIDVIGLGLSPRGNDNPFASSNISTSPVHFVRDLAAAYRASGRGLPLMDELAVHCYPNVNTDSLAHGYRWPNVGCVNLDRLKQAVRDGFAGTAQPTFADGGFSANALLEPLTLVLDEAGWQVGVADRPGYSGAENVPTVDEATQAANYAGLVKIAACDPSVSALHFLYLNDSPNLRDFQSGMFRVDESARPSADAVKAAVAQGCGKPRTPWRPVTTVSGAFAARAIVSGRRAIILSANEDYSYSVSFGRSTTSARVIAGLAHHDTSLTARLGTRTGNVRAYHRVTVKAPVGLKQGSARITIAAWANPQRRNSFTIPLRGPTQAGAPSGPTQAGPPSGSATGTVLVNGSPFTSGPIPYGSTVDVTSGRLTLKTEVGTLAVYGDGTHPAMFVITLTSERLRGKKRPLVELTLVGGDFSVCGPRRVAARVPDGSGAKPKNPTVVRALWGNGKGRFRTRGRYASATVRGTIWLTADRCDGTLVQVNRGILEVRDFTRRKTARVRAGKSFLAPEGG